jgi:hypothetical protein
MCASRRKKITVYSYSLRKACTWKRYFCQGWPPAVGPALGLFAAPWRSDSRKPQGLEGSLTWSIKGVFPEAIFKKQQ